jgi:hypothetical protein
VVTRTAAARGIRLDILKWAHEKGCPWNVLTCRGAAMEGHLEMLTWARENGCPWDEETCAYAAKNGHLEIAEVGAARTAARGTCGRARARRRAATSRC